MDNRIYTIRKNLSEMLKELHVNEDFATFDGKFHDNELSKLFLYIYHPQTLISNATDDDFPNKEKLERYERILKNYLFIADQVLKNNDVNADIIKRLSVKEKQCADAIRDDVKHQVIRRETIRKVCILMLTAMNSYY